MDELLKSSRSEIVSLFNDELTTFLSELLKIFGNLDKEKAALNKLSTYKNLIHTGLYANKESGIEMFSGYILSKGNEEFSSRISNKDYEFFYELSSNTTTSNKFTDIIMIIKNLFIQLDINNKESIFGYLDNLCSLSNIYAMKKLTK